MTNISKYRTGDKKGVWHQADDDAMLAQDPEQAIEGYRSVAPALAEAASKDGVRVGRTSHKLRNPQNAPQDWMKPFLEEFRKLPPDPAAFRVAKLEGGRVGYMWSRST